MPFPELPFASKPEVAIATPECPHPSLWRCVDGQGTEIEVLQFLYALVRMLKPLLVIETGTYLGYGTYHLATAVMENGFGEVLTAEPCADYRHQAKKFLRRQPFSKLVGVYGCTGEQMIERISTEIDFAFLDSDLGTRIGEMRVLLPKLSARGVVAIHDGNSYHDQPEPGPRTLFREFAQEHDLQLLNLDSPRGLILCRPGKDTREPYREMEAGRKC